MIYKAKDYMHGVGFHDAITHGAEIEGRATVTLTDEKTGKKEVIEQKNIVTNAVTRLFQKNWLMNAELTELVPMEKLFGGILCFQNAFQNPDANMVYCPSELDNPMIACAGNEPHNTLNPYRGNPQPLATSVTNTSLTRVWEWQALQGNGTINSLCLTSAVGGNMGLKPTEDTLYCPINTIANNNSNAYVFQDESQSSTQVNEWNETTAKRRPIAIDQISPRYAYSVSVSLYSTDPDLWQAVIMKTESPCLEASFLSGLTDFNVVDQTEFFMPQVFITQPLAGSKFIAVDDADYIYLFYIGTEEELVRNKLFKIDKTDLEVTTSTYDMTTALIDFFADYLSKDANNLKVSITCQSSERTPAAPWLMLNAIPFDNGRCPFSFTVEEYVQNEGGSGYSWVIVDRGAIWIPIDRSPSANNLEIIIDAQDLDTPIPNGYRFSRPTNINRGVTSYWSPNCVKLGDHLYYMVGAENETYLFNGNKLYPCLPPLRPNGLYTTTITEDPDGVIFGTNDSYPAMMFSSFSRRGFMKNRIGYCYSNLYLGTINNMPTPIVKTDTQSMKIQYDLVIL